MLKVFNFQKREMFTDPSAMFVGGKSAKWAKN